VADNPVGVDGGSRTAGANGVLAVGSTGGAEGVIGVIMTGGTVVSVELPPEEALGEVDWPLLDTGVWLEGVVGVGGGVAFRAVVPPDCELATAGEGSVEVKAAPVPVDAGRRLVKGMGVYSPPALATLRANRSC
jgi:hypothetical protein